MKIIIDIDEHIYKQIMADAEVYVLDNEVDRILIENAIYDGKPLPENYGRLIDVNDIWNNIPDVNVLTNHFTIYDIQHFIEMAPTIIESEGSEKRTCANCLFYGTDACSRGAGRAVDDSVCEDFF